MEHSATVDARQPAAYPQPTHHAATPVAATQNSRAQTDDACLPEGHRRLGHWQTNAAKARLAAYAVWRLHGERRLDELAQECNHRYDDTDRAVSEAFARESAVALELIVKAVIARKLQLNESNVGFDEKSGEIPPTHDLPKLWKKAGLPDLPAEDESRLVLAKSILCWSGRYPTPRTAKRWEEETAEFDRVAVPASPSEGVVFRRPIVMGWKDFDRLYQIANSALP